LAEGPGRTVNTFMVQSTNIGNPLSAGRGRAV